MAMNTNEENCKNGSFFFDYNRKEASGVPNGMREMSHEIFALYWSVSRKRYHISS